MDSQTVEDNRMLICIRNEDAENIDPVTPSSSSCALEVFSPEEEAVCAVPWDSGDIDPEEGDQKCPKCSLGVLRWFETVESYLKMCNNLHCDYPFSDGDILERNAKTSLEIRECVASAVVNYEKHVSMQAMLQSSEESEPPVEKSVGEVHQFYADSFPVIQKYIKSSNVD